MASKKVKETVIRLTEESQLEPYLSPELNKIVIINAYENFWGPVEILDNLVRRIIDEEGNNNKMVFLAANKEFCNDIYGKHEFKSKPSYFLFHRGTLLETVDGINLPLLIEKIEKNLELL